MGFPDFSETSWDIGQTVGDDKYNWYFQFFYSGMFILK